jgi:hypothetical protein
MNGRVYDPLTARFLSADPHVTDPTNGQSFNRYSYVLNNPTNLTDPTGFDWRSIQLAMGWGSSAEYYDNKENASNNGANQAAAATRQRVNSSNTSSNSAKDGGAPANSGGSICTGGSTSDTCSTSFNEFAQVNNDGERVQIVVAKPNGYVKPHKFQSAPSDHEVWTFIKVGPVNGVPFERGFVWLYDGAKFGYGAYKGWGAARAAKAGPTKIVWPPNRGFAGEPGAASLIPGARVDRYGAESGTFVAPEGTPFDMRSLPESALEKPLNSYEVLKPIEVQAGPAAPWFGQPGGGLQFELPGSVKSLIESGHLAPVGR